MTDDWLEDMQEIIEAENDPENAGGMDHDDFMSGI